MKYLRLLLPATVLWGSSCSKPQDPPKEYTAIHSGRVLTATCGCIVVQFTDGSPYGQNGWTAFPTASMIGLYHVFKVANPCSWGGADVNTNIRFRFVPMVAQTCALCMAFVPTPDSTYSIEVIK